MRYELSDHEWTAIKPMLPNKPRGVPRVNDRRVLNGIFWILRSGAPWRDLPNNFGPYTTYDVLQPFRSLATRGCLGEDYERARRGPRRRRADDRYIHRARSSARGVHDTKPATVDGAVARWIDQQDSCTGRYQRPAGSARANGRVRHTTTVSPESSCRA